MIKTIDDYINIVGEPVISEIFKKASKLYGKHLLMVNSTFIGGGVAEILNSLIPLMNNISVDTGWRVLHGNPSFYEVTKKIHNALQSADIDITEDEKKLYLDVNESFASYTHIDHDFVVVHDPQPLPLIRHYQKKNSWAWRCHIDLSNPQPKLWEFLKKYILRYDVMIVSSESYVKKDIPIPQKIIHPAIDPLSLKNQSLNPDLISSLIRDAGIPTDKPLITQVSRMDQWKDPEGLLDVYQRVKEKIDCRLLYCYNLATDDPEGMDIFNKIKRKAKTFEKQDVLFVMGSNDCLVNAVYSVSDVIIQKSIKEGFCLCVTEAMWKSKPVVASNCGGIPLQIKDGKNGFLLDPLDYQGFAERIIEILQNKSLAIKLGENAKKSVTEKFLTTRLLSQYLDLLQEWC
ncbi:MAG: glycosyltransferase [Candidatus Aureabacteria bacterium]|nr:glycosyltransferase [Candidatus Auribacterota bacterium]